MGMNEFSNLIKEARTRKRMRGYDLAYAIGQTPSWLSKLEGGDLSHPPAPHVLNGLSNALDIPETEMLKALGYLPESDETPVSDPLSASIARAVEGWTPRQKKLLWQYIEAVSTALDETDAGDES